MATIFIQMTFALFVTFTLTSDLQVTSVCDRWMTPKTKQVTHRGHQHSGAGRHPSVVTTLILMHRRLFLIPLAGAFTMNCGHTSLTMMTMD